MPGFYLDDSDYEGLTALMDRQPYNSPSIPETPPPAPAFPQYSSPDAYVPYTPPVEAMSTTGPPAASPWASGTYSPPPPEPPPFQPSSPWASGTYDPFSGPQLPGGAPEIPTYQPREMGGGLLSPPPISTGELYPTNYTPQEAQQAREAAWPAIYPQEAPNPWAGPTGLITGPLSLLETPYEKGIVPAIGELNALTHGDGPISYSEALRQGQSSTQEAQAKLNEFDPTGLGLPGAAYQTTIDPASYIGGGISPRALAANYAGALGAQAVAPYAPQIEQATGIPAPLTTLGAGVIAGGLGYHAPELTRGAITGARAIPGGIDAITRAQERLLPPSRFGSSELGGTEPLPGQPVPKRDIVPPVEAMSSKVPIPEDARTQVLDALKENLRLRMSGEFEAQKTAGRAQQFAGARSNLQSAIESGAQGEERIAAMMGGMKVGRLLAKAEPLNISPETHATILNAITDAQLSGAISDTEALRLIAGYRDLKEGYRPQPAQLKGLADAFGPEVRGLIKDFPRPPQTIAKLTPEDQAARKAAQRTPVPGEQRTVDERSIRRWELQSQRQHELATQLEEQARLDPTNKRLKAAAETARSRVLDYQNKADEATRTSIERDLLKRTKQAGEANVRAQTPEARAAQTRETVDAQIKQDAAQPYYNDAMKKAMETLGKPAPDSLAAKTATVRRGDTTTEPLNRVAAQTMRSWAENNRTILDGMGADGPTFVSRVKGWISGGPVDSFSATLMARRAVLRTALEKANVEPATASAISRILTQAEIRARFGNNVPAFVTNAIEKTKSIAPGEAKILEGAASLSQEFKNTQFGIGDMAVFGQQGLKAGTTAWPQLIAGAVNRMLLKAHLGGVDLYALADNLPPELRATLDGLGTGHATGIADFAHGEGTLLRHLPIVGRVDPALSHVIDRMTDFQFRTVLGSVRRVNYEGNLLIAKALGKDITNPVVRQQAAIFANSATSFSHGALNTRRALGERAILLSPSMRRAQVSQILQLGKLLDGSATERALAATTLLAWTGSVLSIGKLVNDQVGTGDFEWFPWNSGFGQVKLKDGTTVDLFPQEQVLKTVTRAAKDIAEVNPKDAEAAARQLDYGAFFGSKGFRDVAQLGITSSSPPLQAAERSVGVGYDPGRGYTYGDFGAGTDLKTRLANALPVPPIAAPAVRNLARNGVADTASDLAHPNIPAAAANFAGFNTFPESLTAQRTRDLGANPTRAQVETWNAAHPEQVRAQAESFGGTAVARLDLKQQSVSDQLVFDNQLRDGRLKPADWRAAYASIRDDIQNQQKALDKVDPLPPAKDRVVRAYQQTIDNAKITDQLDPQYGKTDWGKVDAYTASLSPADQKVIEDNRAPGITPTVQQYKDDMAKMRGYFDAGDPLWRDVVGPAFNAPPGIEPAQFFAQKRAAVMAQYRDNPQLGSAIADKVVASYESKWAKIEALAKKQWLSQNIDKVDALARWGYGGKIARDLALVNGQ